MLNNFKLKTNIILIKIGLIKSQIYRKATWFNIISSIFLICVQYYFWKAIYESTVIPEYNFMQMFFYLCTGQIIHILFPKVSSKLSQLVKTGDIVHWLLKPISIFRQFFFVSIGQSIYRLIFIALPILLIIILIFNIFPDFILFNIFKFILVFVLSYLFVFIFDLFIGIFSFHTYNIRGVQSFKYAAITLLSGRFLPLSLYPDWIRKIIEYIPFKIMYYYPLMVLFNKTEQTLINIVIYQIIWIIILGFFTYIFYKSSIKKILIQGG